MGYMLSSIHYVTHILIYSLSQLIQQSHDSVGVISIITILYMKKLKKSKKCDQPRRIRPTKT